MPLPERTRYLFEVFDLQDRLRILDVGANPLSPPPYQQLAEEDLCDVFGFEPQRDAYDKLMETRRPNEQYYPHAVGDGNAHDLHISPNSGFTSLLPFYERGFLEFSIFPGAVNGLSKVNVATVRLDSLADLPQIDMLKIDIQGGEKLVIENGRQKLANAVVVIPEIRFSQLYEGEPMFAGVDAELRSQGFILHRFLFAKKALIGRRFRSQIAVRDNASHLVDGDAVYIRDLMRHELMSDDQIKKLALLADTVFKSFDLVLHCIDHLIRRGLLSEEHGHEYIRRLPGRFRKGGELDDDQVVVGSI
ncbi:FkbM family methyltransferase [Defluviimonas sp. WL0002]|uniref:FkbM family methyltransferase n=1 Tax=Albidovulum marisflavi TaxID=2984159 RepID=A0ABT2ZB67_9RHOB|nr:FkbM family methyltransferase [Defluviimonas sp. WL0002]MCV2868326.1 FkbM family methyltransferase [Defluviimonas sp. WL0002]